MRRTRHIGVKLIHNSAIFRILVGVAILYPLLYLIVLVTNIGIAKLTPTSEYFVYADASCVLPDGGKQAKALEFVDVDRTANGEYVIKMRSCSQFKEPIAIVFKDRLYCETTEDSFELVSNKTEELERARVGDELRSKQWVYDQDFFDGRKCFMDSEIVARPAWFVRKIEKVQSDVFVPTIEEENK